MNPKYETILIVEDDSYDALLIHRAIKKSQMRNPIQTVRDGVDAIDYLAARPPFNDRKTYPLPALMLLDLKLPKKNGFEVLTWCRAQPTLKRLPIVVLTSSSETPDIQLAYDLGANSYLVKPVGTDALVDMLKTVELYWLFTNTKPDLEAI